MDTQTPDVDIDRALTAALEAEDPGPAFAGRVVAAIRREAATGGETSSRAGGETAAARHAARSPVWYAVLPLAATVALTVAGLRWQAARVDDAAADQTRAEGIRAEGARADEARARAAHAQLVQALRLTGEKLNVVHRAIERSQE